WQPVPFTTVRAGAGHQEPEPHPTGAVSGWSGRVWHRLAADLAAWRGMDVLIRWRYTTDRLYVGRGAYVDDVRVVDGGRTVFDGNRPGDARRITATGWTASRD
ncbi:MAG TPA: serine hydrolase, partial [Streptomyces sp.]